MSNNTAIQKKKPIKAVRPKRDVFRANEPLLSVFMWGINHTISGLSHVSVPVMLMPDDFKAYTKTRVDNHLFNKDNMPSHFKFKEYCPIVFRNLRERFGTDDSSYLRSLTKKCPADIEPAATNRASGNRALVSCDRKLFIKTIQSEQVAAVHNILKEYHQYIVERHGDTLLPQYLGMYRVTVNEAETYLIARRNVFSHRFKIHLKYDLKGSTVDRQASDKERAKYLPTLKDNDFLNDGRKITVGPEKREKLIKTIQSDTELLAGLNLMDYSLLVGIHDCDAVETEQNDVTDNVQENELDADEDGYDSAGSCNIGGAPTPPDSPMAASAPPGFFGELDPVTEIYAVKSAEQCPRREIYFIALIDVLTNYGVKKRTAQAAKTMKHGAGAEISTVKPDQYARRFMEFVEKIIE